MTLTFFASDAPSVFMMVIVPNSVVSYYNYIGYFSYYRPSKNKSTSDRLSITTNSDRLSVKLFSTDLY
jgi:hypothetical protein